MTHGERRGPCPGAATSFQVIVEGTMRLEAKRGDIHKAEAETAFIEAVQEALPPDAYKEIRGLPERDIARLAKWAAK